jgi:hypothetical protein
MSLNYPRYRKAKHLCPQSPVPVRRPSLRDEVHTWFQAGARTSVVLDPDALCDQPKRQCNEIDRELEQG